MPCIDLLRKIYLRFPIENLLKEKYANDIEAFNQLVSNLSTEEKVTLHRHRSGSKLQNILALYSREELLIISEASDRISISDCENVFNEYKYGYKPSFVIYLIDKNKQDLPTIEEIHNGLSRGAENWVHAHVFDETVDPQEAPPFKNPQFLPLESFSNNIFEIPFTYGEKYIYIDEEGRSQFIYEYQTGFIWINFESLWMAIRVVTTPFIGFLRESLNEIGVPHRKLIIPQDALEHLFNSADLKAASLIVPEQRDDYPKRIRMSDPELQRKQLLRDIPGYRTSSMYSRRLNSGRYTHVRISQHEGRISTTHVLTTSELRDLGPALINEVVRYINTSTSDLDFATIVEDLDNNLSRVGRYLYYKIDELEQVKKEFLFEVIAKLIYLLKSNSQSLALPDLSPERIGLLIKTRWIEEFFLIETNNGNGNRYFHQCPNCGSHLFKLNREGKTVCYQCSEEFQGTEDRYSRILLLNHDTIAKNLPKILEILPYRIFYDDRRHFFEIYKDTLNLVVLPRDQVVELYWRDIPEFSRLNNVELDEGDEARLKAKFQTGSDKIKEKCNQMSNENCERCVRNREDRICILKLFMWLKDGHDKLIDFRVRPHTVVEWADVVFKITLNEEQKVFTGIAKSYRGKNYEFTLKSSGDLLPQFFDLLFDSAADVIGIIVPKKFSPELKAKLNMLAKWKGKKTLYFDIDDLVRLLKLSEEVDYVV